MAYEITCAILTVIVHHKTSASLAVAKGGRAALVVYKKDKGFKG
ncbi:hypothetical protein CCACVL1_14517 [Corchorus capsularis]|uniref:Uncharacterized protein n=1 Tax=Corchorus capsularis TaxID=210143 RepID=A0A1R3I6Q8_COCAP|nr:hypothetical protein CCACVL1_14517 [Corchorus capsularis]